VYCRVLSRSTIT